MRNKNVFAATAFALLALPTLGLPGLLAKSPLGRLLTPSLAYGQDEDPEVVAEAKKHYKLGQDAYTEAKYDVAIKELKKAYLLKRIPAILVNIAMTYRKTHDFEMSLYFYKKFLTECPPDDKQRPSIETAIAETEKERDAANQPKQLEPAKLAVELAKPVEPAKPGGEPAKPGVEPAKPGVEPGAKPATDSAVATAPAPGGTEAAVGTEPAAGAPEATAPATEPVRVDKPATEWAHTPIDAVPPGQPVDVRVQMPVMKGVKVKVFYRKEGQATFDGIELKRRGNEKVARLPEAVAAGRTFQYYVEARDPAGTLVKSSGSQDSPNIVLIDPTARPQLAGAEAQGEGPDDEELAKRVKTGPKRDIENEAVSFNINEQEKAMSRLRDTLRRGEKSAAKKSALDPVGWAGVALLPIGAAILGGGGGAMFGMAAGRAEAVSSDSMCMTKVKFNGVYQCPHFGVSDDSNPNLALKPASSDFERQGKQFDTIGMVLAGVGGAFIATGGALLIYDLVKRSRAEHPAPAVIKKRKVKKMIEVEEPVTSLQITPVVGLHGVGVVSEYRF